MSKNPAILFVTVLVVAACLVAGASAKKTGEPVSLNAADTVSQDGVTYDFLWTVEDAANPGVDLVTTGVLSGPTGSQASGFNFPAPVVPKGQTKTFKVKAKLTPKTGAGGSLATCIGESVQEITVEGPTDSEIGECQTICETEAETEFARDPSLPDTGVDLEWSVDDTIPVNDPSDHHKAKIPVSGTLAPGHHTVKLKLKNNSGQGEETTLVQDLHVVHQPRPQIT